MSVRAEKKNFGKIVALDFIFLFHAALHVAFDTFLLSVDKSRYEE